MATGAKSLLSENMPEKEYEFIVLRTDAKGKQSYATYHVPADRVSTVLEGLQYIESNIDRTLAVRYSCRMEICGSCGMEINGKPRMACSTIIANLHSDTLKIEPLKHYRIVRDLVVDMEPFFDKYREVLNLLDLSDIDMFLYLASISLIAFSAESSPSSVLNTPT